MTNDDYATYTAIFWANSQKVELGEFGTREAALEAIKERIREAYGDVAIKDNHSQVFRAGRALGSDVDGFITRHATYEQPLIDFAR